MLALQPSVAAAPPKTETANPRIRGRQNARPPNTACDRCSHMKVKCVGSPPCVRRSRPKKECKNVRRPKNMSKARRPGPAEQQQSSSNPYRRLRLPSSLTTGSIADRRPLEGYGADTLPSLGRSDAVMNHDMRDTEITY